MVGKTCIPFTSNHTTAQSRARAKRRGLGRTDGISSRGPRSPPPLSPSGGLQDTTRCLEHRCPGRTAERVPSPHVVFAQARRAGARWAPVSLQARARQVGTHATKQDGRDGEARQ